MYMPPGKGLRLPHFAIVFNALIVPSGSLFSLDEILVAQGEVRSCAYCSAACIVSMEGERKRRDG